MDRTIRDNDFETERKDSKKFYIRQTNDDDTIDRQNTDFNSFNRTSYVRQDREVKSIPETRRLDNDYGTYGRSVENIRKSYEKQSSPVQFRDSRQYQQDDSYKYRTFDDHQYTTQQKPPIEQTQRLSTVNYSVNPIRQTVSGNKRTCVLDLNISINLNGNRASQVSVATNDVTLRSAPMRSTETFDNVRYIDLDLRAPDRTARLSTDGTRRSASSKQSTTYFTDNHHH